MPTRPALRSVVAVAGLAIALPTAARAAGPLDPYLPKDGKIEGHVMTFSVDKEDQAIDRQFRLAVQKNMDWFRKYVQSSKSGQPLPYNEKMGITPAQYDRLQHMRADFVAGAAVTIDVKKGADGSVAFASSGPGAVLDKVAFPAGEKQAETPYGALSIFNEIHQTDERAPIGVWNGAEWAQVAPDDGDKPSAKIAFGKREPSGEGVMYYQVAPFKDQKEQSLVVFYKLD